MAAARACIHRYPRPSPPALQARNAPKPEEKPDTGAFPDAAGEKRDSRGARSRGPPAAAGAREPRSKSREAAPFAGAPGKERW